MSVRPGSSGKHAVLNRAPFVPLIFPLVVCLAGLLACRTESADPPTWPQWRGPARDGSVAGSAWPLDLTDGSLTERWRVPLGPSYSGPVVAADRVFVTETRDKKFEVVRALDRKTGKELWHAEWQGALKLPAHARFQGEWMRSTPAYDGRAVYVGGRRDVLVCLEAGDGKERWRVDFPKRFGTPVPVYGMVSSPLVDGGAVYVLAAASLVKVDRRNGKVLWRSLRDEDAGRPNSTSSATSSPVVATLAGKRQVLAQNRKVLAGVDPDTGEVLWQTVVPSLRGYNVLTPTVCGPRSVFTSAFGGRAIRYDVVNRDGTFSVKEAWDSPAQAYVSSPVVVGGHVYLHLRNQRLTCLDVRTGKEAWTSPKPFGRYWSMAVQNGRILALDQRGILYLVKANPKKFELLGEYKLGGGETWGHLAVCGDELFVRELNAVVSYRWRTKPGGPRE